MNKGSRVAAAAFFHQTAPCFATLIQRQKFLHSFSEIALDSLPAARPTSLMRSAPPLQTIPTDPGLSQTRLSERLARESRAIPLAGRRFVAARLKVLPVHWRCACEPALLSGQQTPDIAGWFRLALHQIKRLSVRSSANHCCKLTLIATRSSFARTIIGTQERASYMSASN